ncbi:MAG TPA: hypothetical protein VG734_03940 [Lacunisphaera sp.]|nr:hypothetical protein [Lacunisphaera sp.]
MSISSKIIEEQKQICAKYGADFYPCAADERAGVALQTLASEPIYGVRKKNEDGTASWYIWGGSYSATPDFYQPLCAGHIEDSLPIALRYLALPPGYKFIIDRHGHEDVWLEEEPNQPPQTSRL